MKMDEISLFAASIFLFRKDDKKVGKLKPRSSPLRKVLNFF